MKRALCLLLALCMVFSLTTTAFAETLTDSVAEDSAAAVDEETVEGGNFEQFAEVDDEEVYIQEASLADTSSSGGTFEPTTDGFPTMVLIDCGRGFYSISDIESIIDTMSDNGYKYLMLGFGNDGLRFVLDDMSVTVGTTTYDSTTIKNAVISANDTLQNNNGKGQWTQSEMDALIKYATSKNIGIVPMLNCPGHAYAVYQAMAAATGITNAYTAYGSSGTVNQYNYSIDLSNSTVKGFVEGLVEKYISYFADKGCKFFNLGCDESKYDVSQTVTYVNDVCAYMGSMVPMAFCDVLKNGSGYPSNLVGINWDGNHLPTSYYHFNANDNWYYVLGNSETADGWSTYYRSLNKTKDIDVTTTLSQDGTYVTAYGSILAIWNDSYLASSGYISNIQNLIKSQAAANPDYFTVVATKDIYIAVNGTTTDTLDGEYSVTTEPDTSIATVATKTEKGTSEAVGDAVTSITSGSKYIIALNRSGVTTNTALTSTASSSQLTMSGTPSVNSEVWTFTSAGNGTYYVTNSAGKYLTIGSGTASVTTTKTALTVSYVSSADSWQLGLKSGNTTYYLNQYGGSSSAKAGGYTSGAASDAGSCWSLYPITTTTGTTTTVTFKGAAVGETTATVGNTKYYIHVTAEDLSNVTLTYYPFLSDYPVYEEGYSGTKGGEGGSNAQTLAATVTGVYTEAGIAISSIAYETGDWAWEGDSVQTVYWKGVLHDSDHKQVGVSYDRSLDGTDFTYVRYYNGSWSVSADRVSWTTVGDTDEVCVYYLQQTSITEEVTTYVKDWAYTTADTSTWYSKDHKALSFSVVYLDGQMSPEEDSIYSESTLIYWYDTGTSDGNPTMMIRVGVNDLYKVSKITWTLGTMTNPTSSSSTNGSLTWEMTTDADGNTWYDETTYWTPAVSNDPVIKTSDFTVGDSGTWDKYNTANSALLILIYLEPVQTEDSLTVRYVDDSNNTEFLNYALNVTNTSTEPKGTFFNRLKQTSALPDSETGGEFTLDDSAYVTNAKGTNETFQKDTTKIPGLSGTSYASGLYEYVKADISTDGKTLTLHYNLKAVKDSYNYVIDFGLPVNIPLSDLGVSDTTGATITFSTTNYGTVKDNGSNITYTPTTVLDGTEAFKVYIKYSDTTVTKTVMVYPATTVFYESNFINGGDTSTTTQTTSKLGTEKDTKVAVYGYDDAYSKVTAGVSEGITSTSTNDEYSFEFTGTGIDIYGNIATDSNGYLVVQISDAKGNTKAYSVINEKLAAGKYAATLYDTAKTQDKAVTGYNVPIFSKDNLAHGTYTVTIYHVINNDAINVDGFRVYNTIPVEDSSVYVYDYEDNPVFVELRDLTLAVIDLGDVNDDAPTYGTVAQLGGQVYTQITKTYDETNKRYVYTNATGTDEAVTAYATLTVKDTGTDTKEEIQEDLVLNGPKNEIYLANGSKLTLNVTTARTLQIGLKGVNGQATFKLNGTTKTVSTVDMFYSVSDGEITIENTSDTLLAVTKLKASDEVTVYPVTEETINNVLANEGFEDAVVTNDASLVLSIKTTSGKVLATTTLTATGDEGTEVTFAKADIKAALADLADANGIKLNSRNSYKDVTVAVGSSTAVSYYGSVK